jgi:predicted O-methyltransferase YrrM
MDIVAQIDETFDLIFIDADKQNYAAYYSMVIDKTRKGGFIIADNVLWSGKILQSEAEMDKDTKKMHEFNQMIQADKRVENVLFPIRDGLLVMRKI